MRSGSRNPGRPGRGERNRVRIVYPLQSVYRIGQGERVGLQVLIAGCPAEERPRVENVSLVKLGADWSVTIDGPEQPFKGLTFMTPEIRLQNAIVQALTKPRADRKTPSLPAVPEPSAGPETRDRHECPKCGGNFVVIYGSQPGERTTDAPVACPHCWQVTHVPVAWSAAQHEDYRAEAI
jgi:hypothetical protein